MNICVHECDPKAPARRLRVLLLVAAYPRSKTDYSGIFVRVRAEHLAQQSVNLTVLAPDDAEDTRAFNRLSAGGNLHLVRCRYFCHAGNFSSSGRRVGYRSACAASHLPGS